MYRVQVMYLCNVADLVNFHHCSAISPKKKNTYFISFKETWLFECFLFIIHVCLWRPYECMDVKIYGYTHYDRLLPYCIHDRQTDRDR